MRVRHRVSFPFTIRNAGPDDVDSILRLDNEVWTDFPADRGMIESRVRIFPEGNLIAVYKEEVVGYLCLQFVDYDLELHPAFTWNEMTGNGTLHGTHHMRGEYMYGVAMTVSPKFQGLGLATRLMFAGWSVIVRHNKKGCLLGSRMPGFSEYRDAVTPEVYIRLRRDDGRLEDPELRLYEGDGFKIICLLPGYENDPPSHNYGVLVYQANPLHNFGWSGLRKLLAAFLAKYGHKVMGV